MGGRGMAGGSEVIPWSEWPSSVFVAAHARPITEGTPMAEQHPEPSSIPARPWTLAEVADYLRESTRSTRRRVKRGDLNTYRNPGSRRLLFDPAEVRKLLAGDGTEIESDR